MVNFTYSCWNPKEAGQRDQVDYDFTSVKGYALVPSLLTAQAVDKLHDYKLHILLEEYDSKDELQYAAIARQKDKSNKSSEVTREPSGSSI